MLDRGASVSQTDRMSAKDTAGAADGGEDQPQKAGAGGVEDQPQKAGAGRSRKAGRPRRSGRRPAGGDSRAEILAAARQEFAEYGYGRATIASIARRAHCDTALVHYFFGTKRDLFDAAIALPYDPGLVLAEVLKGASVAEGSGVATGGAIAGQVGPAAAAAREERGRHIIEQALTSWETDENKAIIVALMRSAVSDEDARDAVQDLLVRKALLPAVEVLGVPDAPRRAVLIGSLIYGLMIVRHVVRMEPIASDSPARLAAAIGPVVDHFLFDDLDGDS
jgi:AcrR family transcriptional regulator